MGFLLGILCSDFYPCSLLFTERKMKRILIYFLLLALFSCNKSLDKWTVHKIDKGQHFSYVVSGYKVIPFSGRHMKFDAKFNVSALYDTAGMKADAYDINKLYGFTDGDFNNNSIRIGWVHLSGDVIEVWAYWHKSGQIGFHKLGTTYPSKVDHYELWAQDAIYRFRFNDIFFETERIVEYQGGVRVRHYPYFGGNLPAPQDIIINVFEYK